MDENPVIGPGNGYSLFEEIESWDFWPEDNDSPGVMHCDYDSLQEVANALWMSSPFRWQPVSDPFSFLASTSLSGAGNPSFHPASRIARAKALGRFAALYAETVLIRDPFEDVLHEDDCEKLRADLSVALQVLEHLRPEIEAGVVAFAPTDFPLCEDGLKVFRGIEDAYRAGVFSASELLIDDVMAQVSVSVEERPDYKYVVLDRLESFVPVDRIALVPMFGNKGNQWERGELSEEERRDLIQTWVVDPSLIDLQFRNLVGWLYNTRYLTDRPFDHMLLDLLDEPERPTESELVARASHALPFIDGLDTATLLKLRSEEGEAFQVYRDKVKELVDEGPLG